MTGRAILVDKQQGTRTFVFQPESDQFRGVRAQQINLMASLSSRKDIQELQRQLEVLEPCLIG